jgi:hypothetical protein
MSLHIHRHKNDSGVFRMFFFLTVFSLSCLIVYFTLGKIYGYGNEIIRLQGLKSNAELTKTSRIRIFPRSVKEDQFIIIVFGWRRRDSLERLVNSLKSADYLNHDVQLQFNIEFEPSEEVKQYVESVNWPYGTKIIVWRWEKYGLERMVVESWTSPKDNEFAFFFEDDIEVQPDFFKFALEALNKSEIRNNPNMVGIALNTPRYDEISMEHSIWTPNLVIGADEKLFLFQQPCSWGALYFPWKWREFLKYYGKRRLNQYPLPAAEYRKVIPESCVFQWVRSWKKYYMEMMVLEGYLMLYPSAANQASLSVHHREEGEHTGLKKDHLNEIVDYFVVPLADKETSTALIEKIKTVDVNKLPIISFHHFTVESIKDLKKFGSLIK